MGKSKYSTVVAAVLAAVFLFSPLLCGMSCLGTRGIRPGAAVEVVPPAQELAAEFAESAVVGCVLTHVVLNVDLSGWEDVLEAGGLVWVGVEAVELIERVVRWEVL